MSCGENDFSSFLTPRSAAAEDYIPLSQKSHHDNEPQLSQVSQLSTSANRKRKIATQDNLTYAPPVIEHKENIAPTPPTPSKPKKKKRREKKNEKPSPVSDLDNDHMLLDGREEEQEAAAITEQEEDAPGEEEEEEICLGSKTSGTVVDVRAFLLEYWTKQRLVQEKAQEEQDARRRKQDAGRDLDHKHGDNGEQGDDDDQNDEEYCNWGSYAPLAAKVAFVKSVGLFNTGSARDLIAKFLITLEQINSSPRLGEVAWLLFGEDADFSQAEYNLRCNIAFCAMLTDPHIQLQGTPFVHCTSRNFARRVQRLGQQHDHNIKWFRNLCAAREARYAGQPLPNLYTPAPQDAEAEAKAERDRDAINEDDKEKLLDFMFQRAGEQQLRRTEKAVYAPRMTAEGFNTRCYERIADIEPWARQQITPKETYPAQFHWYMKKSDAPHYITSHLGKQPDARFPFLQRCRTLFSFRNCIYNAHNNQFYWYVAPNIKLHENMHTVYELPSHAATAKYFDCLIPTEWCQPDFDYKKIKCPKHESIFESQDYTPNEIDWAQALFGRLQHNVGDLDDWQNAIHLEGPAKTGKSLLLKLIALWYFATDIGILGDNVEPKFPDQHLVDKFMVMCMDVSREFGLTPTRFLSWCSGDWVEIHRKGLEAICMKWVAPTIWASNTKPPIAASGGAAKRRYIILQFLKAVENADARLFADATQEVGYHLIKCSMSYHNKLEDYGDKNLYDSEDILPAIFHTAIKEYTKASSWPDAFLDSGRFEFHKEFSMPVSEFIHQFKLFKAGQGHKLEGVNNHRNAPDVACTRNEFANALNDCKPKCRWCPITQRIYGLRFLTGGGGSGGQQQSLNWDSGGSSRATRNNGGGVMPFSTTTTTTVAPAPIHARSSFEEPQQAWGNNGGGVLPFTTPLTTTSVTTTTAAPAPVHARNGFEEPHQALSSDSGGITPFTTTVTTTAPTTTVTPTSIHARMDFETNVVL